MSGDVPDDHDPLSGQSRRQVGEQSGHPLHRLAVTLPAGIRPVDVLITILVDLDGRCAVALTEVALT